jgi:serine/threonine protein kinase
MARDQNRESYLRLVEARRDIGVRYVGLKRVGTDGGDGFFSLVFSATDTRTSRAVAIKVFRHDRLAESYRFQCFCREATLLEQLVGNANILEWVGARDEFVVTMQDATGVSLDLQFPYFAVELAATDIGAVIRGGSWGAERKLAAFREMCKAVQRIHRLAIVHRDIKPSNYLVMSNGDVKLSDFGVARKVDGTEPGILTNYQHAPGDSRYASPEMHALLHDDDPAIAMKADFFSLGATLFELFSGTMLGVQIFDASFARDLARTMSAVSRRDRQRIYLQFVQSVDAGHPLPSISSYGGDIPTCIGPLLDGLYRSMAALDYRQRLCDFPMIFLKIDQCLLVLRNEEKVRRWRQQKEQYKQNRDAKLVHRRARIAAARLGD